MSLYSHHSELSLSDQTLHSEVPAIFADGAGPKTSGQYRFISTHQVLCALRDAGFLPVHARQASVRRTTPSHARHMVRLRIPRLVTSLEDAFPEIVLLNSHDGSSAYELRAGLFRPVCTNGLLVALGDWVAIRIPHRGNVVQQVVTGALDVTARLADVGQVVTRMAHRSLSADERQAFAEDALALRYGADQGGYGSLPLLTAQREADRGVDLWRTYNVIQENLLRGGFTRRTASGRIGTSRRISAIPEEVRLNAGLWQLAANYL